MDKALTDYTLIVEKSWTKRTFSEIKPGSIRGSVFTLCSSTIGAGLLSIPYSVGLCGAVLGFLLIMLGGMTYTMYYKVLINACSTCKIYSYEDIVQFYYGEVGRRAAEISVILICFGSFTAYMTIVVELTLSVFTSLGIIGGGDELRVILLAALTIGLWLPLSMAEQLSSLRYVAVLCVFGIVYITAVVVGQSPSYIAANIDHLAESGAYIFTDLKVLDAASVMFFAYDGIQSAPIIFEELINRSKRRMNKVINRSFLFLTVFYSLLGVLGYLSYAPTVPELILFRQPLEGDQEHDWVMVIGRVVIAVSLAVAVPINLLPTRRGIEHMVIGERGFSSWANQALTTGLLGLAFILAAGVPSAVVYFKLMGGLLSVILVFILPSKV